MASTYGPKASVVNNNTQGAGGQTITNNQQSAQLSPFSSGTRKEPKDTYIFVLGTTAEFKILLLNTDKPTRVDTGTKPTAIVKANGAVVSVVEGNLVQNQIYEYHFLWEIPSTLNPLLTYTIEYTGYVGGAYIVFGHEYFRIQNQMTNVKLKEPAYATVQEIRLDKFNIDAYLPQDIRNDVAAKDALIHHHLVTATKYLQGQLHLRDFHSAYNDNFNLFTRAYTIWLIMGQAMGEDGSAISEKALAIHERKWTAILKQIKMHSQLSAIPVGRG
jgi:hypothetical protein